MLRNEFVCCYFLLLYGKISELGETKKMAQFIIFKHKKQQQNAHTATRYIRNGVGKKYKNVNENKKL